MNDLTSSFESVFNLSPDGNILVDDKGCICIISNQAANIFGYDYKTKDKELLGQPIEILIPKEYRKKHPEQRSQFMKKMGIRPMSDSLDLFGLKKDGTKIPVEISLGGISLGGKKYVLSAIRDVSRRKELEQQLYTERAKYLETSKYAAIGELAGQIAHELNSPLGAISLISDFMLSNIKNKKEMDQEFLVNHLQQIKDIVEKISRITNAMRKLGGGAKQESITQISLKNMIDDVLVLCATRLKEVQIDLSVEYNGLEEKLINCRLIEMSQVLVNLIGNAIDAIKMFSVNDIKPWIKIHIKQKDNFTQISIINIGKNIAPEHKEKIFEPYYTTKSLEHGTGIGLAVSRNIVNAHGGSLYLDVDHENTSFVISLPDKEISA